jgi:4-hydroxy-tetrahydrodipicolinate synthase
MAWEGVHTAIVTPFRDGALDLGAWERLVGRQLDAGVQGIVVCGTTGESPTVDATEREQLLRTALTLGGARAAITMGVGTNDTRSTVENARRASDLGAHAGLLVLPYYNRPSFAGLRLHVAAACETGLPMIVYHVPTRTGQRLAPEQLAELCASPGVVACKEATGEMIYAQEFLARSVVPMLSGDDFTWLPALSIGAAGVISVLSNVAPELTVQVWQAHRRGDGKTAAILHSRLYPVVRYLFGDASPGPCKAMLAAMELCGAEVRLPLAPSAPPPAELVEGLA